MNMALMYVVIYIRMALTFFIGYIDYDAFDVFLWGYIYKILVAHRVYSRTKSRLQSQIHVEVLLFV